MGASFTPQMVVEKPKDVGLPQGNASINEAMPVTRGATDGAIDLQRVRLPHALELCGERLTRFDRVVVHRVNEHNRRARSIHCREEPRAQRGRRLPTRRGWPEG